ncbi:MAG: Rrf2 family transcriptional regulator [Anaerotruncus sp.]|jgi:sirohydrochlorin cobaltochelatase|nr:Rrf2 family transcriptional regulator [Anaerotruncus sp.]
MKISTKGRYALRLLLDLAMQESEGYTSIKAIANRQNISEKYLEQIIGTLVKAGYVTSTRGVQGGYRLAQEPKDYTVGMILRLMEGNLAPVTCLESSHNACSRAEECVTLEVWQQVQHAVEGVVDRLTLADLVQRYRDKLLQQDTNKKRAILVVSFGTSYLQTCDATIGAIEREIAQAYPDYEVRRAFTSQMILQILRKRDNLEIDDVEQAVQRLLADGVQEVICQPTHVINGLEYDAMVQTMMRYQTAFSVLRFGAPLLSTTEDYHELVAALQQEFAAPLAQGDTAVVLMGHGTSHPANAAYAALNYWCKATGLDRLFIGTVEGDPKLQEIVQQVQLTGVKRVILAPLMVVAGDHARNDMQGSDENSWESVFRHAGFSVTCLLKGLGEYPAIRRLYTAHVNAAIQKRSE